MSGCISMNRFARIWVAPWMSATPAWMRITSSWASAAAPVVPDPALAPVLAVQVALVVPAAVLVVPVAVLAQVVLPRDRAVHPVLVVLLLRVWVEHPVLAVLLRDRARMPECLVWS